MWDAGSHWKPAREPNGAPQSLGDGDHEQDEADAHVDRRGDAVAIVRDAHPRDARRVRALTELARGGVLPWCSPMR